MEQITFKGSRYTVQADYSVPAQLASEGMLRQCAISGSRGATGLLQVFANMRRVVWMGNRSVRTEIEGV